MKKVLLFLLLGSFPAKAECFLGDLHYKKGSFNKAVNEYRICADLGDIESMYNIANFYYLGKEVKKSYFYALNYYKKAADVGYAPAQTKAALMYWRGEGNKQDLTKAFTYLVLASDPKDKKWFYPAMNDKVAAKNEEPKAKIYINQLVKLLTPEQKNAAILKASEFKFNHLKNRAKEILSDAEYENFIKEINQNSQNKRKLDAIILNLYKTHLTRKNNSYE